MHKIESEGQGSRFFYDSIIAATIIIILLNYRNENSAMIFALLMYQ